MSNGIGTNNNINSFAVQGIGKTYAGCNSGVFVSTDNGASWTSVFSTNDVEALSVDGIKIYAGTAAEGVYLSTNSGTNWTQTSLNNVHVYSIASQNFVFAGTENGVYLSSNSGTNWTLTSLNIRTNAVIIGGSNVFAGTSNGVYLSTNFGSSWDQVFTNGNSILSLAVNVSFIYAGTEGQGVFLSLDNGVNWAQSALNNQTCRSIIAFENNIFAGTTAGSGIYLSPDAGATWTPKNQGFTSPPSTGALIVNNNFIFAGTATESIWRRSYSEILSVQNISTEIPDGYSLDQNFPNPFNPETKINFNIKERSLVKLNVFDALGKELDEIVNEELLPGTYQTNFNGSGYNSGVYFYRLTSDNYTETKKMLLIK
ncbi:MAG: T9SS type A sorting domain-containing protein [Ignavibacteria bacterium]|nr:T9SS type A sorting domain-containing protein [Ignavibacteria bacterium]